MSGMIKVGKAPANNSKLAKVLLQWDETEISNAIKEETNVLSNILDDVTLLS